MDEGERGGPKGSAPVLRRLRQAGHDPKAFIDREAVPWMVAGGLLVVLLLFGPRLYPPSSAVVEQIATVLSLFFFLTAVGAWFGMGNRSLIVAAAILFFLVAIAYLTGLALSEVLEEAFFLPILVSFMVFALAGFNLLFVAEEMIYDAHRLLQLRSNAWGIVAVGAVVAVLFLIPSLEATVGARLSTLRLIAIFSAVILAGGWMVRAVLQEGGDALIREIHLMVAGALAGAALADAVGLLRGSAALIPSIVAYLAIIGTWLYISFTTLQRAQYFIRANQVAPWAALLLSSSFAVIEHVHAQLRIGGVASLEGVVHVRVGYLVLGVWIGLAFFVLRGLWRILVYVEGDAGINRGVRRGARALSIAIAGVLRSERIVEGVTYHAYAEIERALPGQHKAPNRPDETPIDKRAAGPAPLRNKHKRRWR